MKKILITGANSYVGTSFEKYLRTYFPSDYYVETIDMTDDSWREKSFNGFDSVFHVAGIAHIKETKKNRYLYYKVNRDLAVETAKKAKREGVKQFIFMSSMSVYGMDTGIITKETKPKPRTAYGKSKYQAELEINKMTDETFKVCIIRPPMIYGPGCKGNYQQLVKIVNKFPFFPIINNKKSVISVDNFSKFIAKLISGNTGGLYYPQDEKYTSTTELANQIACYINKKIHYSLIASFIVYLLYPFSLKVRKAFGSLIYVSL